MKHLYFLVILTTIFSNSYTMESFNTNEKLPLINNRSNARHYVIVINQNSKKNLIDLLPISVWHILLEWLDFEKDNKTLSQYFAPQVGLSDKFLKKLAIRVHSKGIIKATTYRQWLNIVNNYGKSWKNNKSKKKLKEYLKILNTKFINDFNENRNLSANFFGQPGIFINYLKRNRIIFSPNGNPSLDELSQEIRQSNGQALKLLEIKKAVLILLEKENKNLDKSAILCLKVSSIICPVIYCISFCILGSLIFFDEKFSDSLSETAINAIIISLGLSFYICVLICMPLFKTLANDIKKATPSNDVSEFKRILQDKLQNIDFEELENNLMDLINNYYNKKKQINIV